jgi:hypothetical protein
MTSPIPSATPESSALAWARFRALLRLSAVVGAVAGTAAVLWVLSRGAPLKLHLVVALGGGVFLALLLGGALMGLVFVSSRLGLDEEVRDGPGAED